jgi:hypothetical protein
MARPVTNAVLFFLCAAAPFAGFAGWFFLDAWDRGWQPGDTVCLVAVVAFGVLVGLPIFTVAIDEAIDRRRRPPEADDYEDQP